MIKQTIIGSAALFMVVVGGGAGAAESGWYLSGSTGQSRLGLDTTGLSSSIDRNDTAWSLVGGYRVNSNLDLELGYTDLGRVSFNRNPRSTMTPLTAGAPAAAGFDATAWSVAAVGTVPFTQKLSAYGKLGLYSNEIKLSPSMGSSISDRTSGYLGGLGLKYSLTPSLGLRGGWERNRVGDDSIGGKGDVDLWSIGLQYRF